jgi:hypothetical protein
MPSVRKGAEVFSQREGVSLNQFINIAIAEKLAHLQHDEWLARRPQPTAARISRALQMLDRSSKTALAPGDELPGGYVSVRNTPKYKRAVGAK